MSEQAVRKALQTIGLTEKEADVYVILAKSGTLGGLEVSKRLGMHKAQVYTLLRNLQRKGVVEATLESPMRFSAVPLEEVLDQSIQARRDEAGALEKQKRLLLTEWRRIQSGEPASSVERYVMIQGRKRIQSKVLDMVDKARKGIHMIIAPIDTLRPDRLQLIEDILDRLPKRLGLRIITQITRENINSVKSIMKSGSGKHLDMTWQHLDMGSNPIPRMITKDDEETLLQADDVSRTSREEVGLWTNSKLIANASNALFEELWNSGIDATEKIYEIENQKPMGRTITIEDWRTAYKQFSQRVEKARRELVEIGPSIDVFKHHGKSTIQEISERNVRVRAMFPIGADNLEEARTLSKYCAIRDPNVDYLGMALIDGEYLFQFNALMKDAKGMDPSLYFRNMFYTTDPAHIKRISEMLEGLWQRSTGIPDVESRLRGRK